MMSRRVTLKDIAARAHVSISTVSYALNDNATIALAPDTRARIRKIAKDMGYVPNSWAQALQGKGRGAVGILLDKPLTLPRYAAIVEGMRPILRDAGCHLVLLDTRGERVDRAAVDDYQAGRIDALVAIGHDDVATSAVVDRAVRRHGLPFVAIDCGLNEGVSQFSSVDIDYAAGVRQVIAALVARGIAHIIHLRPTATARAERIRERELVREVAQRPGLSLQVVLNGIDEALLREHDRAIHDSPIVEEKGMFQRLRAALEASPVRQEQTAVLCSWGADVERAFAAIHAGGGTQIVAALTQGALSELYWPLIYSRVPLTEIGSRCAAAVLGELREDPLHTHSVMAPVLSVSPLLDIRRRIPAEMVRTPPSVCGGVGNEERDVPAGNGRRSGQGRSSVEDQ